MAKTGADYQRERRAAGLCQSCSEPAVRGGRCDKHWLESKQKAAARYQARKAAGLCGMCGKRPKEPDREGCRPCLDRQNEARRADPATKPAVFDKPWHVRNREAGFCTLGGEKHDRPRPGRSLCDACLDKRKKRRDDRMRTGRCVRDDNPAVPGSAYCEVCREQVREAVRKTREERAAAGLCTRCGTKKPDTGNRTCQDCSRYDRAKDAAKRKKLRRQVLEKYGDRLRCFCCHEGNPDLLELDHVNNDGAAHRRAIGGSNRCGGSRLYTWLRRNGFPPGFQLACATCNKGKHRFGECPHSKLPVDALALLRETNELIGRLLEENEQ